MSLTREQIAMLERHPKAVADLVEALRIGDRRATHAELHLELAPNRESRSRLLIDARAVDRADFA